MRKPYLIKTHRSTINYDNVETIRFSQITSVNTNEVAYWLIDVQNLAEGWDTLCQIRRNLAPAIYLKPVVFILATDYMDQDIIPAADGAIIHDRFNKLVLEEWISRLEPINQWIENLPDANVSSDSNIAFKALRLMTSRNGELKPVTTIKRHSGYVYPLLDPLFGKHDEGMLETLGFLESQSLLNSKFVSRSHFCSHCGSAFLNFKESCPHCNSDDLATEELVHHFKCAYIGNISEFRYGSDLVCPKCERGLKHIGVDYDKPSIVHQCNECSHTFQEPKIMTACYNCGRQAEPEHQQSRAVNSYTVSAIGQNAAIHGLDTLFTAILERELNLFSEKAFRDFFAVEIARISRYKVSISSLVMIHFHDLDKLYIKLASQAREVFQELSTIFKTILRQSDVITAKNETLFFIIMTETPVKGAKKATKRLQHDVRNLFQSNLDFSPHMSIKIEDIRPDLDINTTLEDFLKK